MIFVFVRHGARTDQKLSARGSYQMHILAKALAVQELCPTHIFSSEADHALESARILSKELSDKVDPIKLEALKPEGGPSGIDVLVGQIEGTGAALSGASAVVIVVGHEGRLSDLVTDVSGNREHPIAHGGAVCIQGSALADFQAGRGRVHYRYPTVDYQEDKLRPKVQSKMVVSTFLAGFVFTALNALLLEEKEWPWHRVVAAVALTVSLALFVAAVYAYDQIGTPSGFLTDNNPRGLQRKLSNWRERRLDKKWIKLYKMNSCRMTEEEKGLWADDDRAFS
ncbi:hypothetical protein MLGJGCBP_00239 [Rhodococcus sp. T7]|nr:hypothetical protein MLGJGCBP_10149 [Rhodococcus sp. T7]KAF0966614.1 hypothetical protein MLGJGCBP_00239 [Rhodococcus sp. T7]